MNPSQYDNLSRLSCLPSKDRDDQSSLAKLNCLVEGWKILYSVYSHFLSEHQKSVHDTICGRG